jgi:hypothetical protein
MFLFLRQNGTKLSIRGCYAKNAPGLAAAFPRASRLPLQLLALETG